ncbi:MAG: deoxyribonuclease IV [bacterium]|nr:deoxyribonuclease IV [bacterium]
MLLGAHMSIAGGVFNAPVRGRSIGCDTIQIFVKNANQWVGKPISDEEADKFQETKKETGIDPVFSHNSYLINLASPDDALYEKSVNAMLDELHRSEKLKLPFLVIHPGSHVGSGEEAGLKRIAEALNTLFAKTKGYRGKIALETTAGQKSNLGYKFEHLAYLIKAVKDKKRLGVCYDTCHTFAAGYDLRTKKAYDATFKEFDKLVGLDRICAFHLNDSVKELGSNIDRHAHIGQGHIGEDGFRLLLNDERFENIPMVLETPKGPDMAEDVMNLRVLRGLIRKKGRKS